jgi:hypothetical protein
MRVFSTVYTVSNQKTQGKRANLAPSGKWGNYINRQKQENLALRLSFVHAFPTHYTETTLNAP